MQENRMSVALELPGFDMLWQSEFKDHFEVTVIYQRDGAICTRCGVVTTKVQDRRRQRRQDRRLRDKVVFLMLTKSRFRCLFCGKVFIPEPAQHVYFPCQRSPIGCCGDEPALIFPGCGKRIKNNPHTHPSPGAEGCRQ